MFGAPIFWVAPMPARFTCPTCQCRVKVSERMTGHEFRCPKCGNSFPAGENAIDVELAAAASLLPACAERGVGVIVGGVFNSGILADAEVGTHFDYKPAHPELPDLARGSGQALRIFKAEARGAKEDEVQAKALQTPEARQAEEAQKLAALDAKQAELDAERAKITNPDA